jgi:hypothetical protein
VLADRTHLAAGRDADARLRAVLTGGDAPDRRDRS